MLAHGISTGALFLLVGTLYDRRHTFEISEYGGLATPMPKLRRSSFLWRCRRWIADAEWFCRRVPRAARHLPAALGLGYVGGPGRDSLRCYLLWSYQRVFFGEITREKNRSLPDASAREKWILATMAVVTLWMGIGSTFITARTAAAAQDVIDQVEPQRPYEAAAPSATTPGESREPESTAGQA